MRVRVGVGRSGCSSVCTLNKEHKSKEENIAASLPSHSGSGGICSSQKLVCIIGAGELRHKVNYKILYRKNNEN